MDRYKTIIHIEGKSIDDVMRLPCVRSCEKTSIAGIYKFGFYPLCMAHPAPFQSAYTSDYLLEDNDGKWHVMNENTYKKLDN